MEKMIEREYVCKFCNKLFPSGKSLGGHIRIHTNQFSLRSHSYNAKNPNKKNNKKRLVVKQREITLQQQQLCCRECGKGFDSLKDLWNHMDCCHCVGNKCGSETTSSSPIRKRSKKQSSSDSFSNGSSSSEIDQEHRNTALSLMMMSMDSNPLVAEILEKKLSSGEQLKMIFNVKNQDLKTDEVALDGDDDDSGGTLSDSSYSSDSDYFMNGPKKSDSDIWVDECPVNTGFNRFRDGRVVLPCYESDSCADTNSKIHSKSTMVKKASGGGAKKDSKGHECPICFRVFKSGQALGGHKRSHSFDNQEHRFKHRAADMRIDLNFPAQDTDE